MENELEEPKSRSSYFLTYLSVVFSIVAIPAFVSGTQEAPQTMNRWMTSYGGSLTVIVEDLSKPPVEMTPDTSVSLQSYTDSIYVDKTRSP